MRRTLAFVLCSATAATGFVVAQAAPPAKKPAAAAPVAGPQSLGIDETAIDKSVNPCDDFYQYACGGWLKRTEIPADRSNWMRSFSEIDERNETELRKILDGLVEAQKGGKSLGEDPYGDKLVAVYGACMDEAKVESGGAAALKELFAPIDGMQSLDALGKVVAQLHAEGSAPLFRFGSQQDLKDATQVIGGLMQGGLGLPDRDYYLKDDAKFKEYRTRYVEHVAKMFTLAGVAAADAQKAASTVMALETELAKVSLPRVELRDPKKLYHRLELAGVEKTAPKFNWKAYLTALGFPSITQINVFHPPFVAGVDQLITKTPIADLRTYLKWHRLHTAAAASALPKAFVDENFAFFGKTLQGTAQILPRWKRCVQLTDHLMGEALARPFVRLKFGADAKADTQAMVKNIEAAMEKNLAGLAWFDDATRKQAYEKLHSIVNKIGYPDAWRKYDALEVKPGMSFLSSVSAASRFETNRDLAKIGKPLDRGEWQMSPPTVNAYYEPSLNEMVFPAGILQTPFYAKSAHPSVNYGAIGMVIGHELTHGFDDEGRQFDAKGNLRDWWSPSVNGEFEKRTTCVKEQYDAYTVLDNVHLNGKLTLGENIADLGGIKLAYAAYVASRGGKPATKVGNFTDDQLFFLGTAQSWCGKRREALVRMRVVADPHSPPEYRINGPMSNLPEFGKAFSCKPTDKMVRKQQCVVW